MPAAYLVRSVLAGEVQPGTLIEHPESGVPYLVDAVTRSLDGLELACYPPGRHSGKRIVLRPAADQPISEIAGEDQRRVLLEDYASAQSTVTPGKVVLSWPEGWLLVLEAEGSSLLTTAPTAEAADPDEPVTPEPEPVMKVFPDSIETTEATA